MNRLPWRRKAQGRFVAYPNGDDHRDQVVRLGRAGESRGGFAWTWTAEWKGRFSIGGNAETKQRAADLATEAWWRQVEKVDAAEQRRARLEAVLNHIELGDAVELDLTVTYPDLMQLMTECTRRRPANPECYGRVMMALSAEFFRRRIQP